MEINSKPEELDEIDRKIMQLEIEREAIKRENDNSYKIDTDLFIEGTLKANNLEIIGQTTIIETETYQTENLLIDNTDADGPSLKIKHHGMLKHKESQLSPV